MSDGELTQEQKDAGAAIVQAAIRRFREEGEAKPNPLKPTPLKPALIEVVGRAGAALARPGAD